MSLFEFSMLLPPYHLPANLLENWLDVCLDGCQNYGWFGFLKTLPTFNFSDIHTFHQYVLCLITKLTLGFHYLRAAALAVFSLSVFKRLASIIMSVILVFLRVFVWNNWQ